MPWELSANNQGPRPGPWIQSWRPVCLPGWHGPSCGVPTVVQYSNLPTKERLVPREVPRRVINAININHEFDLLDAWASGPLLLRRGLFGGSH